MMLYFYLHKVWENKMDVQSKLQKLKKRLGLTAALSIAAMSASSAEQQDSIKNTAFPAAKETKVNTFAENDSSRQNQVKQYCNFIEIGSLEELNSLNRQAACYNQYADAIIYTQYKMSDADKSERSLIEAVNNQNYSVSTEAHEKLHRLLSPISQKLHDGSCILKVSDRIRVKIMEEICCLKSEKRLTSITDAIQKFKDLDRITYYSNHYGEIAGERIGSVLIAKTAEEKTPEKIDLGFERSSHYKPLQINGQEYIGSLYVSRDKKYKTWALHDLNDQVVTSAEILSQSPLAIGVMTTAEGKDVKMPDGKTVRADYRCEAKNNHGGWAGYAVFKVDNFENRKQGYDFHTAQQNFDNICGEYANATGLTALEAQTLKEYVSSMDWLNAYDLQDSEIRDIRDNYKDVPLQTLVNKQKSNYEQLADAARTRFEKETLPHLVEVQSPSSLISGAEKSIKTDAFKIKANGKEKGCR